MHFTQIMFAGSNLKAISSLLVL